jgi:hypothetical protein
VEDGDFEVIQLELKYCEYCGGLWLRQKGQTEIYCSSCLPCVTRCAVANGSRSKARLPVNRAIRIVGRNGEVLLCSDGGNA